MNKQVIIAVVSTLVLTLGIVAVAYGTMSDYCNRGYANIICPVYEEKSGGLPTVQVISQGTGYVVIYYPVGTSALDHDIVVVRAGSGGILEYDVLHSSGRVEHVIRNSPGDMAYHPSVKISGIIWKENLPQFTPTPEPMACTTFDYEAPNPGYNGFKCFVGMNSAYAACQRTITKSERICVPIP